MQAGASHQKSKYEKLNKAFTKRKIYKEENFSLSDSLDSNSLSSSEYNHSSNETWETSIIYDSDSAHNDSSSTSIISKDNILLDGCRDAIIIDKLKTNGKSMLKEHKLL